MSDDLRIPTTYTDRVLANNADWLLREMKNALCTAIIRCVPAMEIPTWLHSDIEDVARWDLTPWVHDAMDDGFTRATFGLYLYPSMLRVACKKVGDAPSYFVMVTLVADEEPCNISGCDNHHFDLTISVGRVVTDAGLEAVLS